MAERCLGGVAAQPAWLRAAASTASTAADASSDGTEQSSAPVAGLRTSMRDSAPLQAPPTSASVRSSVSSASPSRDARELVLAIFLKVS